MTVTLQAKHDISKIDDNDNETCCIDKQCEIHDHAPLNNDTPSRPCQAAERPMKKDNEASCTKFRRLLSFDEAPTYMKHNHYIRTGYRGILNSQLCLESVFWWTNETINIWSHIFGLVLFLGLALNDVLYLKMSVSHWDKCLLAGVIICFLLSMFLSALYHTFSCRSEKDCEIFLSFDLFGIALALFAIYASGIYYAFWCDQTLQNFYLVTVTVIFLIAMALQIPQFNVNSNVKITVFVAWAAYGVMPTLHWFVVMGGLDNPVVCLLLPRVIGMYLISGVAFLIYITKIPERFFSGKFDYLGHSHQWWHFFIVLALYHWHNSGMIYVNYRMNHACYTSLNAR